MFKEGDVVITITGEVHPNLENKIGVVVRMAYNSIRKSPIYMVRHLSDNQAPNDDGNFHWRSHQIRKVTKLEKLLLTS